MSKLTSRSGLASECEPARRYGNAMFPAACSHAVSAISRAVVAEGGVGQFALWEIVEEDDRAGEVIRAVTISTCPAVGLLHPTWRRGQGAARSVPGEVREFAAPLQCGDRYSTGTGESETDYVIEA